MLARLIAGREYWFEEIPEGPGPGLPNVDFARELAVFLWDLAGHELHKPMAGTLVLFMVQQWNNPFLPYNWSLHRNLGHLVGTGILSEKTERELEARELEAREQGGLA